MRELRSLSGLDPHDHATVWTEWQRIPVGRRIEIAHAMVELAEDNIDLDFTVMFQWLLDDADATVRASAIEGLWECDGLPVLRRMLALLHDPAGQVRAAAAMALGRFAYMAEIEEIDAVYGQQVHDALLALIRDPAQPTEVRRRAIESAGYFAASDAVQQQIELAYASSDQLMRESALTAMGRSMLPRWLPIVSRELESPSPALRYEAARAAGEMADLARSLVARVVRLCNDADTEVALAAIWALGQIGGETARRTLQRISGSDDEARSQAAAEALDELTLEEGFSGGDWRNN
ncbi:HEAT repeat domain-containing protein [Roseiflexus castenholzii]|nr:HEAT repeat domain-containing protein [Roseiflexus castenholzii]